MRGVMAAAGCGARCPAKGAVRVVLVVALLCAAAGPGWAQQSQPGGAGTQGSGEPDEDGAARRPWQPSFGASLGFASDFVWRGFVVGTDPVAQPSVWMAVGPFTVSSWSSAYTPSAGHARYSEHDFTVDYSRQVGSLTLSAGWINYAFPLEDTGRHSNEFYWAIAGGGYARPKLQVYHDVHQGKGTYATLSAGHDYRLGESGFSLAPSISLGYNHHQWTGRSGFSDLTTVLAASVPTPVAHLGLQPFVAYTLGMGAPIFPRRLYWGLTLTVE